VPGLNRKREAVKEKGWWLPQIAKEHGGLGLSLVEHGLLSGELGRSFFGNYLFNCQAPDAGNMEILLDYGTPEQLASYFKPVAEGAARSSFGMTEPHNPGSNPVVMSTAAVKEGNHWVLNGRKWYVTGYEGCAFCIVMAVTNPDAAPHDRASMIIVPADTEGIRLVRNIPVMGEAGADWMSHGEIVLEDCRVPEENLLGEQGKGFHIAQARLGPGRIHHCMRWIGICERCFDVMCNHAVRRELNPGQPLGTRQFVQGWVAESRAEIDAAKLLVLRTAAMVERDGGAAAREAVSMIKFHVAGVLQRVMDRAIQTLGGLGMCDDTPVAWFFRHERAARIYDGADEVHKIASAKHILRRYGLPKRA